MGFTFAFSGELLDQKCITLIVSQSIKRLRNLNNSNNDFSSSQKTPVPLFQIAKSVANRICRLSITNFVGKNLLIEYEDRLSAKAIEFSVNFLSFKWYIQFKQLQILGFYLTIILLMILLSNYICGSVGKIRSLRTQLMLIYRNFLYINTWIC